MAEINSLKNLSREEISKMLYNYFQSTGATIVKEEGDIFKAMVPCTVETLDQVAIKVASGASIYMDQYIEKVLEENPKYYNRNLILFESEPAVNFIFFRWFK